MKSEPSVYGIDDLERDGSTSWTGVRNYQVRNMFRDEFGAGDLAFFHHSSCAQPGIVGTMTIAGDAYADPTQFDRKSEYFDGKSRREAPTWLTVDVRFQRRSPAVLALDDLRRVASLADMVVLRRGNRLSVVPVSAREARIILGMIRE